MKSLRSVGIDTALLTFFRSSRLPLNPVSSVSTEIAWAPAPSYPKPSAWESGISARKPLEGLERLISAISFILELGARAFRESTAGSRASHSFSRSDRDTAFSREFDASRLASKSACSTSEMRSWSHRLRSQPASESIQPQG